MARCEVSAGRQAVCFSQARTSGRQGQGLGPVEWSLTGNESRKDPMLRTEPLPRARYLIIIIIARTRA